MNVKEMIQLNNEKRNALNNENLTHYENMLMYIRINSTKSERATEELLLELLDHLLDAQTEGRTATDVFGTDLKSYSQELITEIPTETKKEQFRFATFISVRFLAIISFVHGIIGFGLYFFFQIGSRLTTFHIGSTIAIAVIDLCILFLFIYGVLRWLQSTAFQTTKTNKWIEFFQVWIVCMLSIGLFVLVIYFMPEFGGEMSVQTIMIAGVGIVLYLFSFLLNKRSSV